MLDYMLMLGLNITLFLGEYHNGGDENILNVSIFIMWVTAIIHFFAMLVSDETLRKEKQSHILIRISYTVLLFASITHSVYWGYIFVPAMWLISVMVLWVRRYEINNGKRY